jgi:hypothetical protein
MVSPRTALSGSRHARSKTDASSYAPSQVRTIAASSPVSWARGALSPAPTRTAAFLRRCGFYKTKTAKIIEAVPAEEQRKPECVFYFVQWITAVARDKTDQDARLDL